MSDPAERAPEGESSPDDGRESFDEHQARRLRESRAGCLLAVAFLIAWIASHAVLRAMAASGAVRRGTLAALCIAFLVWMARRDQRGVQHGVVWLTQFALALGALIASLTV
jgi:hypothetical protein